MTYSTTDTPAKTLSGLGEVRRRSAACGKISSRQLISHKISRNVKTEEDPGETRDVGIAEISVQTAAGRMLKGSFFLSERLTLTNPLNGKNNTDQSRSSDF